MTSSSPDRVAGGSIVVRQFQDTDRESWDRFVVEHPRGTFFHLSKWRNVIEQSLGHDTCYLLAERGSRIEAVLPLARVRSWLFGDAMISLPFAVYGGVLTASEQAKRAIEDAAIRRAESTRVEYLEMRNLQRDQTWDAKSLYSTFRKSISADPEQNMQAIPRKQRAMIRKGIKAGLQGAIDASIDRFYDIYSTSVRNLGTPVLAKSYFCALKEEFGAACEVLSIEHRGSAVASVMSFYFKDEVLPYYGGGLAEARSLDANDFMYWDLMCRSAVRGARLFDFGRSKQGTGSFKFKTHWGFEPHPLHYQYHLIRATAIPDLSPLNPRYRTAIAFWRRLPLSLTRLIGPPIARVLG